MASSSVSQEDADLESLMQAATPTANRTRSRIRATRVPASRNNSSSSFAMGTSMGVVDGGSGDHEVGPNESHESSPKPRGAKDKRCPSRPAQTTKAKMQRRKLREKRRSTGVVHLPSTESTGGSTEGEEEGCGVDAVVTSGGAGMNAETRRNTQLNENVLSCSATHGATRNHNKSPSDLDADDEDNAYDSTVNQSDSALSLATQDITLNPSHNLTPHETSSPHPTSHLHLHSHGRQRPETPCSEKLDELLERAREENSRLLDLIKSRDDRITALETRLLSLSMELSELTSTNQDLKEQNAVLLNALANSTGK